MQKIFKPFIWMFSIDNFRLEFFHIIKNSIVLLVFAFAFYFGAVYCKEFVHIFKICYKGFFLVTFLYILGYFWFLTKSVIDRKVDVSCNNIYSTSILSSEVFIIHFPKCQIFTYIYRGVASSLAILCLVLPIYLLAFSTIFSDIFSISMNNINIFHNFYTFFYNVLYFLFFFFSPAMLWLYAKYNSVVAVWRVSEAVEIIQANFLRYIFYLIYFYLFVASFILLNNYIFNLIFNFFNGFLYNIILVIFSLILLFEIVFFVFVLAYILGILIPIGES